LQIRSVLPWLSSLILLGGAAAVRTQGAAEKPHVFGNPEITQYAPNRTYHVENYRIAAHIDMAKGEIAGEETVRLRALQPGFREFYLNSAQLQIDRVVLAGKQAQPQPLAFRLEGDRLWIRLAAESAPAELLEVHITYHGNPEGRAFPDAGLSFIRPDASMPTRPLEVWSYGWPQNNHFWFPCWDYPNDKSTSEVILTVPEPLSVVSNGKLVNEQHGDGQATFDWVEQVPHSAYLISIAVGPWKKYSQTYNSKPVDYYVPPSTDEATAMRSFGLTPDMMGFYSNLFGVEYPYEKYAQTADHNFGGGTENISATSLAESTLHDARAEQDYPSIDLVSHELAHQWFGDLVTEYSWDEAWLSEGFATFSAALYRGHHDGNDEFRYQIWRDQQTAMGEDTSRYRRPIVDRHYAKPWDILDRTTYQKGAAVLDMLRYVVDEEVEQRPSPQEPFFRALQNYLITYRAKNVDTQNLIDTIRQTTGMELNWFFDEWIAKGGYPQYAVETHYDATVRQIQVTVRQTQTVDAVTPLFDMPVQLAFYGAQGQQQQAIVRVRSKEETFTLPLEFQPQWVDFDPEDHIYKTLTMGEPMEALIARGERDRSMTSRLWAAEQLGHVGEGDKAQAIEALTAMLAHDPFYGVRMACAVSLGQLGGPSATTALLTALRQPDSRVRTAALEALSPYASDVRVFPQIVRALHEDDSYAAQAAAAQDLGAAGSSVALEELQRKVSTHPSTHVMRGILPALSHFNDPRARAILQMEADTGTDDESRTLAARSLKAMTDNTTGSRP
jgi:aminopeptidase N